MKPFSRKTKRTAGYIWACISVTGFLAISFYAIRPELPKIYELLRELLCRVLGF